MRTIVDLGWLAPVRPSPAKGRLVFADQTTVTTLPQSIHATAVADVSFAHTTSAGPRRAIGQQRAGLHF
jgi:hypothetical protein